MAQITRRKTHQDERAGPPFSAAGNKGLVSALDRRKQAWRPGCGYRATGSRHVPRGGVAMPAALREPVASDHRHRNFAGGNPEFEALRQPSKALMIAGGRFAAVAFLRHLVRIEPANCGCAGPGVAATDKIRRGADCVAHNKGERS